MTQAELVSVAVLRGLGVLRFRALGEAEAESLLRESCGLPGHTSVAACGACTSRFASPVAALAAVTVRELLGEAAPAWVADAFAPAPAGAEARALAEGWRLAGGDIAEGGTPGQLISPLAAAGGASAGQGFLPLRPLGLEADAFFPAAELASGDVRRAYAALYDGLRADSARALAQGEPFSMATADTLQALLLRYTWSVPAGAERSTSLYAVVALAAAISACYTASDTDVATPLALLGVDLSGLQAFLYTITSGGAARGLRGRSLYLDLLTDAVNRWWLRELGLPGVCSVYVGGGRCYLLTPAIDTQRFELLRARLASLLVQHHRGDLYVACAAVPIDAAELAGAGTFWPRVNAALAEAKRRRFAELPTADLHALFAPEPQPAGTAACTICQRQDRLLPISDDPNQQACSQCHAFMALGRDALEARFLAISPLTDASRASDDATRYGGLPAALGLRYRFSVRAADALPADAPATGQAPVLLALNDTDVSAASAALSPALRGHVATGFRFLGSRSPLARDKTGGPALADFDALADASRGTPQLGVLRMDVDDLGLLFRGASAAGLSGVASLSLQLRVFFEGHVGRLVDEVNAAGAERIAVIYAGGDDLFAVGSWSALPDLAARVRAGLARLAAGSPAVHISGGLAGVAASFPIHRAADLAHEALDGRAKRPRRDGRAKDAIDLLGHTFSWAEFAELRRWQERLITLVLPVAGDRAAPRAVLQLLQELYLQQQSAGLRPATSRRQQAPDAMLYGPWLWRGAYALARLLERSPRSLQAQIAELQQAICAPHSLRTLAIAARWAELLVRGEGSHDERSHRASDSAVEQHA